MSEQLSMEELMLAKALAKRAKAKRALIKGFTITPEPENIPKVLPPTPAVIMPVVVATPTLPPKLINKSPSKKKLNNSNSSDSLLSGQVNGNDVDTQTAKKDLATPQDVEKKMEKVKKNEKKAVKETVNMKEEDYADEEFEKDEEEEEDLTSSMPLDSDGLPCMVRMMSMKSIDHDDLSESDTGLDSDDNDEVATAKLLDKVAVREEEEEEEEDMNESDSFDGDDFFEDDNRGSGKGSGESRGRDQSNTATSTSELKIDTSSPAKKPVCGYIDQGESNSYKSQSPDTTGGSSVDNTVLDGVQVRKYFGRKAKDSFSNKVQWMSRQHLLHDLSPDLVPLAASSPNSVLVSKSASKLKSTSSKVTSHSRFRAHRSLSPHHNIKYQRQNAASKSHSKKKGDFRSIKSLQGLCMGKHHSEHRSNSVSSVGSLNSISSLDSSCSGLSLKSGISSSNATPNQLLFDDANDLDADMYVNHADYKKGACLDIENLLHHLTTEKGKKDFKNKLILETMYKREDASNHVIQSVRASTPDVSQMPSQGHGLNEVQSSPRSMYIAGCISNRLNPRASHVIRKDITQELHLEHFGMGDSLAVQLAQGIKELPMLYYINISDNNLTDKGMKALLSSVTHMPQLYELNMSDNIIGEDTAYALQQFLNSERDCPLHSLILKNANVDDYEGAMFIRALQNNTTLTELDLSRNLIGGAEILNSVRPDLITAVESLAELIRSPKCVLKTLTLAWNNIRLDSAVYFCKALTINTSILSLDLSYNSLSDEGGRAIGEAILENNTLQTLLLSNNNIGPAASFIICTSVEQNTCLRKLILDNNPIGEAGAKAIMNLPNVVGSRLNISAAECNVGLRAADCWFNESDPCRKYTLDMTNAYERAVAYKLLTLCAHHHSYEFVTFSHVADKHSRPEPIHLKQKLLREKIKFLTKNEKRVLSVLYKIKDAAKDVTLAQALFHEYDVDHSGEIDLSELGELLDSFGMHVKRDQLGDAMAIIDVDGSGGIELPEFLKFIRDHQADAIARIKEMTELPTMVEKGKSRKYVPPKTGVLHIELRDGYVKKEHFQVITASDQKNITKLASRIGSSPAQMIGYSFGTSKMRLVEAYEFYEVMMFDMGDKARVLACILPHMIVPSEARMLVSKVTRDDPVEVNIVRNMMGNALRPIFGLPCGYYHLEFSKEMDRICLSKLLELEGIISALRRERDPFGFGLVGDTSQYRNWSSFRNCFYNGAHVKVTPGLFSPIPKTGKLEFDFSGAIRPLPDQSTMSDTKLVKILINLALVDVSKQQDIFKQLQKMTSDMDALLQGTGKPYFDCTRERAELMALAADKFVKNIPNRGADIIAAKKREEIKHDFLQETKSRRKKRESRTNMDPFMQQTEDEVGLMSAIHEQVSTGMKIRSGSSLLAKLKAKRCFELFAEHGKFHDAVIEQDSPSLKAMAEEEVGDFHDEELEQEHAMLREVEKATAEREKRLQMRRKSRALLRVESICFPAIPFTRAVSLEEKGNSSSPSDEDDNITAERSEEVTEQKKKEEGYVTLPSIEVVRNGKTIILPSVVIKKRHESKKKKKRKEGKNEKAALDIYNTNVVHHDDSCSSSDDSDDIDEDEKEDNFNVNYDQPKRVPSHLQKQTIDTKDKKNVPIVSSKSRLSVVSRKILVSIRTRNQRRGAITRALILDKRTLQQTRNRRKLRDLLTAVDLSPDAKGVRLMAQVIDMMGSYWLRAKQVAMILKYCQKSVFVKFERYWGSYRVDIVVSLFSRLVDVFNFELILVELSPAEAACVYMRIGWLNIFNPMKVEGSYELEMSRWEERMVAKLLISIAIREPGENIINGAFQWDRDTEKTPGWVITQAWRSDASMHRKGYLSLTFAGKHNHPDENAGAEFQPDMNYRRALLSVVLIREEELRTEQNHKQTPDTPGKVTLRQCKSYWLEYLYGDRNIDNKVTQLLVKTVSH